MLYDAISELAFSQLIIGPAELRHETNKHNVLHAKGLIVACVARAFIAEQIAFSSRLGCHVWCILHLGFDVCRRARIVSTFPFFINPIEDRVLFKMLEGRRRSGRTPYRRSNILAIFDVVHAHLTTVIVILLTATWQVSRPWWLLNQGRYHFQRTRSALLRTI